MDDTAMIQQSRLRVGRVFQTMPLRQAVLQKVLERWQEKKVTTTAP